ncbi:MAG: hypothetical protein IJ658_13465, partial [Kiritimatiellae bacterium]|nr:hypothetical protein [Kiritimatiellia bacterium]
MRSSHFLPTKYFNATVCGVFSANFSRYERIVIERTSLLRRVFYQKPCILASALFSSSMRSFLPKLNATGVVASTCSQAGDAIGGIELFPTGKAVTVKGSGIHPFPH